MKGEGKLNLEGSYYSACEIIEGTLATWGAGVEGMGFDEFVEFKPIHEKIIDGVKWPVVDCRDMEDGSGNPLSLYEEKINDGIDKLDKHGRLIVCCIAGISRSNSIAAGILIKKYKMDYIDAIGKVKEMVPYAEMEQAHLNALKKLFPSKFPYNYGKAKK